MQVDTLDLSKIRKGLQIQDKELLNKYLKEIWSDLSKRTIENSKGITKVTFNKYYDLPGIISERMFAYFDKDKDGALSLNEFVNGMQSLFSQEESFDSLAKFIFNLYDFNSTGIIKKDDVRVVLSYVPLQRNDTTTVIKDNIEIVEDKFEDRVESQEQLFHILNIAFKNKEEMNFEEYINVIKNVNSDIFILLLMFLLEKKPFSSYSIQLYALNPDTSKLVSSTPKLQPQKIASPSLQSRFLSPKLKNKKLDSSKKKGLSQAANLLQLYSGVDPNKSKKEKEEKEKVKDKDKDKKKEETKDGKPRPQRRVRIKLDNLVDKSPELSKNTFTFGKNVKNEENTSTTPETKDEDDDLFDIQEDQCVQYEGYVYKYSQSKKKIKKRKKKKKNKKRKKKMIKLNKDHKEE